ncbi:MAG: hypothetical protein FJ397_04340 [Verrucomicrobia bacterium]|nr:hypothetical protein [Verrucomicrobiota bacterium]
MFSPSCRSAWRLLALLLVLTSGLPAQLVNTSVRVRVGTGDDTLISGFVVGAQPRTFLFRAVGPTLASFGVGGVLADPILTLFGSTQNVIATNNDWGTNPSYSAATITAAMASAGAFALPAGSRDAVLIATLPSGAYTVQVTGANSGTGVALFEAYELAAAPVASGTIRGRLQNLADLGLVGAEMVFRNAAGAEIGRATTRVLGFFDARLPAGAVRVEFPGSPAYVPAFQLVTVVAGVTTELPPLLVAERASAPGTIRGRVTNAVNGSTLSGATLRFREGSGVQTGTVAGTTTSSASGYTITLSPGTYTAEVSLTGYITSFFTVIAREGNAPANQDLPLSPVLGANEFRIVLFWGVTPADLDAHLTGPHATISGARFHVYFDARSDTANTAKLDLDDLESFGPETITISSFRPGVYRYSVHDYTNRNATLSTALSSSGAQVVVFRGSTEVARFTAPTGRTGTLWTVFEIDGTTLVLTPRNEFSNVAEPLRVTAPPLEGGVVPETDAEILRIGRKPKR